MNLRRKILVALCALPLVSCSPRIVERIVTETKVEYRDSTIWRDSTILVPIPLEKDKAIVTINDTSKLATSVAHSEAWVGGDGLLHHNLENNRSSIPYAAKVPTRYIYTGVTQTNTEKLPKIEYRDKPLSWWKAFKIAAFPWLIFAIVLLLIWVFRRSIAKLIL